MALVLALRLCLLHVSIGAPSLAAASNITDQVNSSMIEGMNTSSLMSKMMSKSKSARRQSKSARRRRRAAVVYAKEATLKKIQGDLNAMKADFSSKLDSFEEMVKAVGKSVAAAETTKVVPAKVSSKTTKVAPTPSMMFTTTNVLDIKVSNPFICAGKKECMETYPSLSKWTGGANKDVCNCTDTHAPAVKACAGLKAGDGCTFQTIVDKRPKNMTTRQMSRTYKVDVQRSFFKFKSVCNKNKESDTLMCQPLTDFMYPKQASCKGRPLNAFCIDRSGSSSSLSRDDGHGGTMDMIKTEGSFNALGRCSYKWTDAHKYNGAWCRGYKVDRGFCKVPTCVSAVKCKFVRYTNADYERMYGDLSKLSRTDRMNLPKRGEDCSGTTWELLKAPPRSSARRSFPSRKAMIQLDSLIESLQVKAGSE
jgi:hypothetical protein